MIEKISKRFTEIHVSVKEVGEEMKKLSTITVTLSADPVSEGLANFNKRISDVQKSKDFVCQTALRVISLKNSIENMNTSIEKYIMERKNQVMKSNPDYYNKELKSQAMRDIALEKPLQTEMELHSKITQLVTIIKGHYASVQLLLDNLESTNNNLKKQLDVIEKMISIGEIESKFSKGVA